MCLQSLSTKDEKRNLAEVFCANERKLKALKEIVAYKERYVDRIQNIEEKLKAINETKRLVHYLKEFPMQDESVDTNLSFLTSRSNSVYTMIGCHHGDEDKERGLEYAQQ